MDGIKILFLDIDGVLNDSNWIDNLPPQSCVDADGRLVCPSDNFIDPVRVSILNRILRDTGASVVITSTWRCTFTPDRLQTHLRKFGFDGTIIDATADDNKSRFNQISDWLDQSIDVIDDFIILDDIPVIHDDQRWLMKFQHIVDPNVGLTDADADKIIARLK
jgi:hypothetical protein